MANFNSYSPGVRKEPAKPVGKLVSFFVQPGPRSQSESGNPGIRKGFNLNSQGQISDMMPQGKSLNIGTKKLPVAPPITKYEPAKLVSNENDERYQYLMKRGIIRRVEKDEKIIFAELPGLAGVLVVYRSPSERNVNPERLNLDRRELTQMPLLEGEERLRLLNYQHNFIAKIENLLSLPNLIFLDLYNNQIKEINGLHTVPSLRVLMLGKNLIEKVKNLNTLTKLDVLDLHSNKISKIEGISHLQELRVLNLANNLIVVVENLEALKALTEVNLRRNLIENVKSLGYLAKLQRVFLSNNKLEKFESIECLGACTSLTELALDGNPLQMLSNYNSWVIFNCRHLTHLDLKKVTPDMKDPGTRPPPKQPEPSMPTENLISVIGQEWKNEMERLKTHGLNFFRRRKEGPSECLVQSGHAEIESDSTLFIYGNALEVITKSEFQDSVSSISFQYIRFDHIVQNSAISKLRKFTALKKFSFTDNNLHSCIQLSKLESLQSLQSINIDRNDVIFTVMFRSFIVYRFPALVEINEEKVCEEDKIKAKQQFQNFDRILCTKNILKPQYEGEDRDVQKNSRMNSKKNSEFAVGYVQKIIVYSLGVESKARVLENQWDSYAAEVIRATTLELSEKKAINEESLYGFFRK